MEVNLVVVEGRQMGQVVPVKSNRFVIGRDDSCQLRPRSASVSKHHCAITRNGKLISVEDLGSTNGTIVNDQCLHQGDKVRVQDGTRIQVGQLIFSLRVVDEAQGAETQAEGLLMSPTSTPQEDMNSQTLMIRPNLNFAAVRLDQEEKRAAVSSQSLSASTASSIRFVYRKFDDTYQVASIRPFRSQMEEEAEIREARKALYALAASPKHRRIVLDLDGVELISSMGCAMLLELAKRCDKAGGGLRVCGLDAPVKRKINALRLHTMIGCYDDRRLAVTDPWE